MPLTTPLTSEVKRTPSSYEFVSELDGFAGAAVAGQIEHGHASGAPVVNDHMESEPSALPAASVTVPLTVAVYVVDAASAAFGVSFALFVPESYATVAGTVVPDPSLRKTVEE